MHENSEMYKEMQRVKYSEYRLEEGQSWEIILPVIQIYSKFTV